MTALDRLIPAPRLAELDEIDLDAPVDAVWRRLRHGALAESRPTRLLFALRTLISRADPNARPPGVLRIDDLVSTPAAPGFQVLADEPPREVAVGAIGQVWKPNIPFVHVADARAFAVFAEPDYIKVAWALRLSPHGDHGSHVEIEVRVAPTSARAWRRFRPYFLLIGPFSRRIRRRLLRNLQAASNAGAAAVR